MICTTIDQWSLEVGVKGESNTLRVLSRLRLGHPSSAGVWQHRSQRCSCFQLSCRRSPLLPCEHSSLSSCVEQGVGLSPAPQPCAPTSLSAAGWWDFYWQEHGEGQCPTLSAEPELGSWPGRVTSLRALCSEAEWPSS